MRLLLHRPRGIMKTGRNRNAWASLGVAVAVPMFFPLGYLAVRFFSTAAQSLAPGRVAGHVTADDEKKLAALGNDSLHCQ